MTILDDVARAVRAAGDKKAVDLTVLEVPDLLAITDYFVICSGTSERHVKTIAEDVEVQLKQSGLRPLRVEGTAEGGWILVDLGVFVVHVFTPEAREYYDLERLWRDAPRPELPELVQATEG